MTKETAKERGEGLQTEIYQQKQNKNYHACTND